MLDKTWREGFAELAPLNLTFDALLFHTQLGELTDLARAFPQHDDRAQPCRLPDRHRALCRRRRDEVFGAMARRRSASSRKCENVVVKLGGLRHACVRLRLRQARRRRRPPKNWRRHGGRIRHLHRRVRAEARDVREQFPGRQDFVQLQGDLERASSGSRRAARRAKRPTCSTTPRRASIG